MTATMKYLSVAVLLCGLLTLSNADCFIRSLKPGMTHCQDDADGTWHEVGSSWRDINCYDCSCSGCCSSFSTPRNFPSECMSVFDSEACVYRVYKKDDPSVECPIFGAVGK